MKKLTLAMLLIAAIALVANAVSADLTVSGATLGDSNAEPGTNASTSFTLTNTGTTTITGISLSSTASSAYSIGFSGAPSTLAAGGSATVTVNGVLAKSHDAVTSALKAEAISVGSIVASGSNGTTLSGSGDLKVQVANQLEIKKVYITVNGDDEHSLDDGDDLNDLKPGDTLDIRVVVENNYDEDDDDISIEDVIVRAEISDSDFDLDEDDEISDISADDEDSVTFNDVEVDDEASGKYTLEITVEGRGESPFSGRHGQKIEIDLDVERESHEIIIRSASLSPSRLACDKNSFDAKLKVFNSGKNDEDEVAIEIAVPSLGVTVLKEDISLDENDESSRTIPVLLPAKVAPGTYTVELTTFWNNDIESDKETLSLIVDPCAAPVTTAPTAPVVTTPPTTAPTTTGAVTATTSTRARSTDSFLDSPAGLATLGVGILAAIVIIIVLIAMMVKKDK
ncbi:hypothetical protein HY492_03285 [Candidatus Woesearchaeota archaeon]|nr:hypothetical protein [Candidatus Woesearchaeota archaeon]